MGWISRMIQRGDTVNQEDASAAIHAYHVSGQYARWAEVDHNVGYEQRSYDSYCRYLRLSQGLDWETLERIASQEYE